MPRSILTFPFLAPTCNVRIQNQKGESRRMTGWEKKHRAADAGLLATAASNKQCRPAPSPCDNLSIALSIRRFRASGIPQRPPTLSSFSEGDWIVRTWKDSLRSEIQYPSRGILFPCRLLRKTATASSTSQGTSPLQGNLVIYKIKIIPLLSASSLLASFLLLRSEYLCPLKIQMLKS